MDENVRQMDFNTGNNKDREYKIEEIWNSIVYAKKFKTEHLT